jgi:hypothetical protein
MAYDKQVNIYILIKFIIKSLINFNNKLID